MDCSPAAAERPPLVRKPAGGFRFITTFQIAMAWSAYRDGLIRLRDLRCWFACHELLARRCRKAAETPVTYTLDELHRLVGGKGGEHLRAALRRLERARLITWNDHDIRFAESPDELRAPNLDGFWTMLNRGGLKNRRVPVPRRTIRLLAGGAAKVTTATILGHLLRCCFYRRGGYSAVGCCKASWIAAVFEVDLRGVKRARRQLAKIGWLTVLDSEAWHRQRWGGRVAVNLAWSRPAPVTDAGRVAASGPVEVAVCSPAAATGPTELPPPPATGPTVLPPLESHTVQPSSRCKNQEPASGGPACLPAGRAGVCKTKRPPRRLTMRHVIEADLDDTERLLRLLADAQDRGLIGRGEADRLRFVAAAERARTVGVRNPCGLFVRLVRAGLWHHITQDDEDAAQTRLKRYLYGPSRSEVDHAPACRERPVPLSADVRFVMAVRQALAERRYRGDPFEVVRREFPEWTRGRWDNAMAEWEQARVRRFESACRQDCCPAE